MEENCRNCEDRQACVPFFVHENSLMHYSRVNKRMLILFCVWCATIAVIIGRSKFRKLAFIISFLSFLCIYPFCR